MCEHRADRGLRRRIWSGLASTLLFLFGGSIYVSLRSTDLLMFRVFPGGKVPGWLAEWRSEVSVISMPDWFCYSLPDGLWLLAYMLLIDAIWWQERGVPRSVFLWSMPAIALAAEALQAAGLIPGSGDWRDVAFYAFSILIFIIIKRIKL